jgi:acyl transferase domain-containing protein/acyl carrier protein/SAM-dependent methyltransferase
MSFDPDIYLREGQSSPDPDQTSGQGDSGRIAIVGMAGRFPGARDIGQFWHNLKEGKESISFFPESETENPPWARLNPADPNYVRAAGILDEAECFDASLFGYSPREAEFIDPQQRVFLEICWSALEHAGYDPKALQRAVGVFAGTVYSTYLWRMLGEGVLGNPAERMLATIGNLEDNLTTRVAYKLNLRGPAITVQTACSSSLVAVNLACQSLLERKCDMALAGGVCVVFPQKTGYLHNPDLIDSRDGHCRAFCEGSTGAVFSNGAGVVVLKRLAAAQRDGDTIHAVILGSAVNNDGNDKIGYTAPSISGQADVIRKALTAAAVDASTIGYVEAHGTGTPLGDPIEVAALAEAFGGKRLPGGSCAIGSVKTNIGHLNVAAGIAGLIKAVLALRHREIPPSLHFKVPNPALELEKTPFYVNAQLAPWARDTFPRRAGISSFGVGGTNAHVILEEAAPQQKRPAARGWHVIALSGRDARALEQRFRDIDAWLDKAGSEVGLGDVAFTLNAGRTHFTKRAAFVAQSLEELRLQLQRQVAGKAAEGVFSGASHPPPAALAPHGGRPFGGQRSELEDNSRSQAESLARSYTAGQSIDWESLYEPGTFRRIPLPAYPFARTKHWLKTRAESSDTASARETPGPVSRHEVLGPFWSKLSDQEYRRLFQASDPAVGDHRIGGQVVLPGVIHLEMARAAAANLQARPIRLIRDVHWLKPILVLGAEAEVTVRLHPIPQGYGFRITDGPFEKDGPCSQGQALEGLPFPEERKEDGWLSRFQAGAESTLSPGELYGALSRRGLGYGPYYRRISAMWRQGNDMLALVEASSDPGNDSPWALNSGLFDSALQCTCGLYSESERDCDASYLPYSAREIQLRHPLPSRVYAHASCDQPDANGAFRVFQLELLDETGLVCLRVVDLCCKTVRSLPNAAPTAIQGKAAQPDPSISEPASKLKAEGILAVERRLRRLMAGALHVTEEEIDIEQAHADYGVDSVLAVGIVKSINDEFGADLRVTDLFSYGSIRQLGAHLQSCSTNVPLPSEPVVGTPPARPADFAVIGMSCRFPGAGNVHEFWANLDRGIDSVTGVPMDRWGKQAPNGDQPLPPRSPRAGFLGAIDRFDPLFFNISPLEAETMDPQQRLFLEESWKALEDAGYTTARLDNLRCGVFVGVSPGDYGDRLLSAGCEPNAHAFTGNATSILAARIAYILNLKGPCVALDTACSSSLVAVHMACQSILAGDSDVAIAGGVHLMATDRIQRLSAQAGMLSPSGLCRTFDDRADGMVLAEGVGVVVLKRLADALRDADSVYGVIRGSGINQDGKTNGITAPSPISQTELELAVYRKADLNPETISFVEAHGTGTALGDPIELRALSDAFRQHTKMKGFCAIGSVKTNIGHCMTAAGMASLIKVLLSLDRRRIPASLNFEKPSRHFDFPSSPFFVNRRSQDWTPSGNSPLRAAVSSFGFSGTNAHLVLEAAPQAAASGASSPPHLVPLSAKSPEALRARVQGLLAWAAEAGSAADLPSLAYTLGARRTHFAYRAFWVVDDQASLVSALAAWLKGETETQKGCPECAEPTEAEARRLAGELGSGPLATETRRGKLAALGASYLAHAGVPWDILYAGKKGICLRLPPYPFAEESHWLSAASRHPERPMDSGKSSQAIEILPGDWVASDHVLAGEKIVAGAALLEMALAFNRPAGLTFQPARATDVEWLAPLRLGQNAISASIEASQENAGLACRISSGRAPDETVHFRCRLATPGRLPPAAAEAVNLRKVLARAPEITDEALIYGRFSEHGLEYGPAFRRLKAVYRTGNEVWGRIVGPAPQQPENRDLQAAMLDAAFQVTAFLAETDGRAKCAQRPLALGEITLLRPLEPELYVRARLEKESDAGGFRSYEITLFNTAGEELARLANFLTKASPAPATEKIGPQDFFYRPTWKLRALAAARTDQDQTRPLLIFRTTHDLGCAAALAAAHPAQVVIQIFLGRGFDRLGERTFAIDATSADDWRRISEAFPATSTVYFLGGLANLEAPADLDALRRGQELGVLSLFRLARAFLLREKAGRDLTLKVITAGLFGIEGPNLAPWSAPMSGLAKVMSREFPGLKVSFIDLEQSSLNPESLPALAALVAAETIRAQDNDVAYRNGLRYERVFEGTALAPKNPGQSPFRKKGTYLILGGAGGIGLALSRRLAASHQAQLVLVGRRPLDETLSAHLRELEELGGTAVYCQADASDVGAIRQSVSKARERFGRIHGVIHSALVLDDAAIWKMDETQFRAALEPKVCGSWVLAEATSGEQLDFLAFFSSSAGLFGNPGQGNYAAGCAFKDAYGQYLAASRPYPVRAIDWGFWGEIGAVATDSYRRQLAKSGIVALTTEEGLDAFERILSDSQTQVVALKLADFARDELRLAKSAATAEFATAAAFARSRTRALEPDPSLIARLEELGRHGLRILLSHLTGMGLKSEGAPTSTLERLKLLGAQERFARWLDAALERLVHAGYIESTGGRLHLMPPAVEWRPSAEGAGLPDGLAPYRMLLDACLKALPDVLRGKLRATEVIFPGNSLALLEPVYGGNPLADFYNSLVADAAEVLVFDWIRRRPGQKIRIIEIGAGTGATTAPLIKRLSAQGSRLEYVYTDISASFFNSAQERFAAHSFVSYRAFDVERDAAAQGFPPGSFDLAIASNVLHACGQLGQALGRIHGLLRPGGVLLLNELTQNHDFLLLTFGLTEGWWKFNDSERKGHDSPLLDFSAWGRLLQQSGFPAVEGLGGARWGNHVMMAERDDPRVSAPTPAQDTPGRAIVLTSDAIPSGDPEGERGLREQASARIWRIFAERLKLSGKAAAQPPGGATFDQFGVDSLITLDLIALLEKDFGPLPKTLLFEHTSLGRLSDYLVANHRQATAKLVGASQAEDPLPVAVTKSPPAVRHAERMVASPRRVDIAIIGISGRYPGAANVDEFWENLKAGTDSITEVPADRWDGKFFQSEAAGSRRSYSRWGGFIDDIDKFDPLFFGLSPRTAELMDPQERLFLQTAWSAIEDAGYTRRDLSFPAGPSARQQVGVFAGVMYGSYQLLGSEEWARGRFVNASSGYWCIPNRVSYVFDLEGPSLAVDSACSSSLSALHLACESLRGGECEVALAGGVNLILHPSRFTQLCSVNMLSPDGVCRPFGDGANGFVEGEGVGVVLLKPLEAAIRDGDNIRAVIKGSAINSGGKTSGFTVPNPTAQAFLVRKALERSGLTSGAISYVEAHGTGTTLGDPIEVAGLSQAFREDGAATQFCAIGSVKSNIGHLEAAAGIAAVTKVALMLKHRALPPSLHAETLNPLIEFEQSPFRPQRRLEEWSSPSGDPKDGAAPLRAGVSSFGAGGANAHMILEEFTDAARTDTGPTGPQVVVLSARTTDRLREVATALRDFALKSGLGSRFCDAVFTLQVGREALEERLAFSAEGWEGLAAKLDGFLTADDPGPEYFRGSAAGGPHPVLGDSDAELTFIRSLYESGRWEKLAAFWASGSSIDWAGLRRGLGLRRVALPTYPFARIRHWIPAPDGMPDAPPASSGGLHPLLDANVSTLKEIRFQKVFTAADDALRDHIVGGRAVLPAVAYLEMVRAAAEHALERPVTALANVVWLRPLAVEREPLVAFVTLVPLEKRIGFEVWTGSADQRIVHARGNVPGKPVAPEPIRHDLKALIGQGKRQLEQAEIYRNFSELGLSYGSGFQTVRQIWATEGWALARLELNSAWARDRDYTWHPGLLDGALQSIAGLVVGKAAGGIQLPFSMGKLWSLGRLGSQCFAWVRQSEAPANGSSNVRKFEVTLMDESGNALIQMEDCALRAVRGSPEAAARPSPEAADEAPAALKRLLRQLERRETTWEQATQMTRFEPATESRKPMSPHASIS